MNRRRLTSIDLAKLAGVSSATVSRAFTPGARISSATRARILSLADEHNYRPNAVARSLNSSRSRLVALVVNAIANPCEAQQLDMLVHRLQEIERMPLVLCCANHADRTRLMHFASAYQVEHVVLCSDMVSALDAVDIFRSAVPIIASFEPVDDPSVARVRIDGEAASSEIANRLVDAGRRHFAYLSGRDSSWVDKQRRAWVGAALARHDLTFVAEVHGDYSYESAFKEAVMLLRRGPIDVVFCGNDVMAIGVRDAAERLLGRGVPDDLAIVGHDGIEMSGWESHGITTIGTDHAAFCDAIVRLIEPVEGEGDGVSEIVVPCHVKWGTST